MTEPYQWTPMPAHLDILCPVCASSAKFTFASVAQIHRKTHRAFFEKSDQFEYVTEVNRDGQLEHFAIYYHYLKSRTMEAIGELPNGYLIDHWALGTRSTQTSAPEARRGHGTVICQACGCRATHELNWPMDAWFQIEHGNKVLWAFDREYAAELRNYLAAENRDRRDFKHQSFLMKIPSVFLKAKARAALTKKLGKLLLS